MFAPSPRVEGLVYEVIYGMTVFRCDALRATIQPKACADNFTQRRCLACKDCPTGAIHSGKPAPQLPGKREFSLTLIRKIPLDSCISRYCIRCGKSASRIMAKSFCATCWNRMLELTRGRNGKGCWPRVTAEVLHRCNALFSASNYAPIGDSQPIKITRYAGAFWVSALLTDDAELSRLLDRIAPGATLIDSEFLPVRQS